MKIALVIEHFDAARGGAEHAAVWLAHELARRGHDVHVVCHDVSAKVNRYRQATQRASHDAQLSHISGGAVTEAQAAGGLHDGVHIHRLRGMRVRTGFGYRLFGVRARRWCMEHRPDVVHSLTLAYAGDIYHACGGLYAAMQAQALASRASAMGKKKGGAGAALKRVMQKLTGKERTLLTLERRMAECTGKGPSGRRPTPAKRGPVRHPEGPQRIISLCAMMTRQLQDIYGIDGKYVVQMSTPNMVLPRENGHAEDGRHNAMEDRRWLRAHYGLADTDRVALFVGHDFRRKGLRYAIEAVAQTHSGWKLLVVGLGKAREYVELAQALGIGEIVDAEGAAGDARQGYAERGARVLFVGPTREMDRMYAAADALLLPTYYEAFGLVALEAFGHGLPVISTAFLGAGELVRAHDAGTIVPSPRSVEDMAAALDALPPQGSPERTALARRAREAAADISAEKYMDALLALYERVREKR